MLLLLDVEIDVMPARHVPRNARHVRDIHGY